MSIVAVDVIAADGSNVCKPLPVAFSGGFFLFGFFFFYVQQGRLFL